MREIITLQFGSQSNYIGTHFWNAQESYFTYQDDEESPVDHDIHFRPGIGADGSDTFTPRTVVYDVKESFGTLRQVNALYNLQHEPDPVGLWTGTPILRQTPQVPLHEYQSSLEAGLSPQPISSSSVRFWSDFNRVYYHPRSLVQLNLPTSHLTSASSGSQLAPLDLWETGEELFSSEDQEHDLLDRDLRPFVEESDQMQGFQVISTSDDAWAAFSAKYIERLRDGFGRKAVWVWGSEDSRDSGSREKKLQQTVNLARTSATMAGQASLYIPLATTSSQTAPDYLSMAYRGAWETSALQATLLESATLPSRLRASSQRSRGLMGDLEATFTNEVNRNILQASLGAAPPASNEPVANGINDGHHQDHRMVNGITSEGEDEHEDSSPKAESLPINLFRRSWGHNMTRRHPRRDHIFTQILSLRGSAAPSSTPTPPRATIHSPPQSTIIETFSTPSLASSRPTSFPPIFRFAGFDAHAGVSTKTALMASTGVAERMRFLGDIVGRAVGVEEREELRSDLLARAEEYVEGWDSGDEDSDDD